MTTQPLQCQGLNADPAGLPVPCKARATAEVPALKQFLCQTHLHLALHARRVPHSGTRLAREAPAPDAIDVPYEEFLPRD